MCKTPLVGWLQEAGSDRAGAQSQAEASQPWCEFSRVHVAAVQQRARRHMPTRRNSVRSEPKEEPPGPSGSQQPVFKVDIKDWHAIATWTWNAGDDVCGICRMPFDGCPPDGKFPGDDSPVVWGTCGHAFHLQCITKWLTSQTEQRCPFCRRLWEYKAANTLAHRR
ncbi:hypothetical protein WJX73_008340 [Symbiochloris irregularis]|uniref:Anaphase-promoting complex subunit 11 n=1 Tax=Symbiochloris irregularis TaxID=706552 RepID=A0AAW1NRR4_9CHLO